MKFEWDMSEIENFFNRVADTRRFEAAINEIIPEIADALRRMLIENTPVVTGELRQGWDEKYRITKAKRGFLVEIINRVPYAGSVNYGHPSHNQYNKGGKPYLVKNRIKITQPHPLQNPKSPYWVWGSFFVERSLLEFSNQRKLESLVKIGLQKWWRRCLHDK